MTPAQFTRSLASTRMDPAGKTAAACRLVLVDGLSQNAAAKQIGVDIRAVSRAVLRLEPPERCPTCNQPVRERGSG